MLTIIGGTYLEYCTDPHYSELYGSGLRAAIALSQIDSKIAFSSCIGKKELTAVETICDNHNISHSFKIIEHTVCFDYYHPLSQPDFQPYIPEQQKITLSVEKTTNVLCYGMIEAMAKVECEYAVYDAQNGTGFKCTGSSVQHLAIVLNKNEAQEISGLQNEENLEILGKSVIESEGAEVVVIKNGPRGAMVIENNKTHKIPVFATSTVWPIGSGDIFSAVFAWKWMLEGESPFNSAMFASRVTAYYCESRILPLPKKVGNFEAEALPMFENSRVVYLAGPFFNTAERWLINELRNALISQGSRVFSPYHDVGLGTTKEVAQQDLENLQSSDVVLAVLNGLDAGTIFEIGFAKAIGKRIVLLAENVKKEDLLMFAGSGCDVTDNLPTAVYKASW